MKTACAVADVHVFFQACNDFYTRIPHEFGMRAPPMIRTAVEVKKKIELLEALGDIQVKSQIPLLILLSVLRFPGAFQK